jgi:hypothetical protein
VIAPADTLADAFAETPIPTGPISDAAADIIARILWEAAEGDDEQAAAGQGGDGQQSPQQKTPTAMQSRSG